tara:strand:+ start:7207 stop:19128 length:11922 start_codon:yes stop_codon:yes gene_type:complete
MATMENKCRLCTGIPEGVVLYRYTPTEYQIDSDCIYGSLTECNRQNNPRKSYISPNECLVWFTDNGGDLWDTNGGAILNNKFGQTNQQQPIPTIQNNSIVQEVYNALPGDIQARLWAYDITGNTIYYADSFKHEGSDIAVGNTNMWVGCEFSYQIPSQSTNWFQYNAGTPIYETGNFTINSYNYSITENDVSTFNKTPDKVYRLVDENGNLIRQGVNPADGFAWGNQSGDYNQQLGPSIGTISDSELLADDARGNIYYVDLTNFYKGDRIYSITGAASTYGFNALDVTWTTSNSVDSNGDPYMSLASHSFNNTRRNVEDGWYFCSNSAGYRVYTVIANKIVSVDPNVNDNQGDIKFNPSDPVLSGDPSLTVTYSNSYGITTTCPQNPGGTPSTQNTPCGKNITKYKFPTDLNNITIQTYSDRFITNAAAVEEQDTPEYSGNLVEDVSTGNLYSFARNYRWLVDSNTLNYSNPVQGEIRLYDSSGIGQMYNWYDSSSNLDTMVFRGGAQVPSCVVTSAYTYNCSINGCLSVLGTDGVYSTLSACSADCVSWSCSTLCECLSGITEPFPLNPYQPQNYVNGFNFDENLNVQNQSTVKGDTCSWSIPHTAGATGTGMFYFPTAAVRDGNQQSSWGIDGTRFCLNEDCTTYQDLTGPTSIVASGFWGGIGNYLTEGRLNAVGVWPYAISTNDIYLGGQSAFKVLTEGMSNSMPWDNVPFTDEWNGISRCITVTGTTSKVYLIGVGASDYYRIGVDGVTKINTSRPEVSEAVTFNTHNLPTNATNQERFTNLSTADSDRWWVHRIELTPGEHSITVEALGLGRDQTIPYTAPLQFFGQDYKAIGVEIVGPFPLGSYTTSADVLNLTPYVYTANTIFSTIELAVDTQVHQQYQCPLGSGCGLGSCYLGHVLHEPIPYTMGGSMLPSYPDPYRVYAGIGGTYGWEKSTISPIQLPNGGYCEWGVGQGGVNWKLPHMYFAPQVNGVNDYHANTGLLTRELEFDKYGYVTEDPTVTPYANGITSIYSCLPMQWGFQGFCNTTPQSPDDPCISPIPSHWGVFNTYQKGNAPLHVTGFVGGDKMFLGGGVTPTGTVQGSTWEDIIDWLNDEGLLVSSVPDPGTTNYPNIDYNATFFQVIYAMADYWTPAWPNGAPNGPNAGGLSNETFAGTGGYSWGAVGPHFLIGCYDWCNCAHKRGQLDTTPISCGIYDVQKLSTDLNTNYNQITIPNSIWERNFIWDSCLSMCVTTSGCAITQDTSFSGGCSPIVGTGNTNISVFSSLTACEEICTTGTTTGVTYWTCGDSGCTTASTVTPFTSLTQCTGSCISYNCTDTGCTEFNPPASTSAITSNMYGTGGTFTNASLCWSNCTSYQCGNWGCSQYQPGGTGGTYSSETQCTGSCISYECLSNGCNSYQGSGFTYSSSTDCLDICVSYECTQNCCEVWNAPFYGTGGTYFDYTSSATSLTDCQNACASWGCNTTLIASGTSIYVYYDTAHMGIPQMKKAFQVISAWTQSLYNFTGTTNHILVKDERWLSHGSAPFDGALSGGTVAVNSNPNANTILQWAYNQGVYSSWYDDMVAGQSTGLVSNNGTVVQTKGFPSAIPVTTDVLVISLVDEAVPAYHGMECLPGNALASWTPYYSGGTNTNSYQPTSTWKTDYVGYTTWWNTVTASTGSIKAFVYPVISDLVTWTYNPTTQQLHQMGPFMELMLNITASISEGNKTDSTGTLLKDGTWNIGTAPRSMPMGGVWQPGTGIPFPNNASPTGPPPLCGNADLTALELPENPYYTEKVGLLSRKGWGSSIALGADFNLQSGSEWDSHFINVLTTYLGNIGGSVSTGCISACTTPTTNYPYSSQTACISASTDCEYYNCTNTGCQLATIGTGGSFTTLTDCENTCKSWNCNNVSGLTASTVGGQPCEEQTGTGGTFSQLVDCTKLCTSYQCFGYNAATNNNLWGCQSVLGTGSTFSTYSGCSADCKSWECTSPCSGGTNSGCTQYPYSGLTYSSETQCTGSCISTWWCIPEVTMDSCSGRTMITPAVDSGINGTPGPFNLGTISDIIANSGSGLQFTNFSQIKYIDLYLTGLYGPNGTAVVNHPAYDGICMHPWTWCPPGATVCPEYFVMHPEKIDSALVQGGPWFVYNDFIQDCISIGIPVNLNMDWVSVCAAIENFYQTPPNMGYTYIDTDKCICNSDPCGITCENGANPPVPSSWSGPYATSGDAYTVCCANTWDCTEGYEVNSCSGRTNISIGSQFNNSVAAVTYVSQNLPNVDVTTLYYESDIITSTLTDPCLGPNGSPLMKLQAFDYSLLNNGISYSSWNYFIHDLQQQGLNGVTSGMSYDVVSLAVEAASGTSLDVCTSPCRCTDVDCTCIQLAGSGGTYASSATCFSALTNGTSVCDCPGVTGSSWNCYNDGPYEPTCGTKPYIGHYGTIHDVVDFYRANTPNQNFIDNKFTNNVGIIGGTLNTYPIIPFIWSQVWSMMSSTTYDWTECFKDWDFGPLVQTVYLPFKNIWWIAHPQLTGGNGVYNPVSGYWEYANWNDFYGAAVGAGVPLTTTMSFSSACSTMDTYFNPAGLNFQCAVKNEWCCSGEDCWCVQQWNTGGTYTTNTSCLSACCPSSGYTCLPQIGCMPAAQGAIPFFPTQNDCQNCLTNPLCPDYGACATITWDCNSGFTYNSCDTSIGPINLISPGSPGNQTGAPFITNPPTYPFSSDSITTASAGIMTDYAISVVTNHFYWDPAVQYSAATYEINSPAYTSGNISLPAEICYGPNGFPQFRYTSIGHKQVNNGVEYSTWESFVSVASASPYSFNVSVMMTAGDITGLHPLEWNVTIEPCICRQDPCHCDPVIGWPLGQFSSSAACESKCCEPEVTYDCTINGCVDPGTALGAYTGYNAYNLCIQDCYEWECNGLSVPDCECTYVVGTGHTPTANYYAGTALGYFSCSTGCCPTIVLPECPILITVDDSPVTQDAGVYNYDITTNISQLLLSDPGYTFSDVSYWKTNTSHLIFTYHASIIKEWEVTTGNLPVLNRTINLGQTIGKGLTNINQLRLLACDSWWGGGINEIDLINATSTTANITPLFGLPGNSRVTGDIVYDPSSNLMLILYSKDYGHWNPLKTKHLGKFDYNGNLVEDYLIPTILSGNTATEEFSGIICNVVSDSIGLGKYVTSESGFVFEIIESPTLSIAPAPIHMNQVLDNIGSTNNVTGAEGKCGCKIKVPETYDCKDIPGPTPTSLCVDPGTGLGQFTMATALANNYLTPLAECQASCTGDDTSWECHEGIIVNDCSKISPINYSPYPLVQNAVQHLEYLCNNQIPTSFSDTAWEQSPAIIYPTSCLGPNGQPLWTMTWINCTNCGNAAVLAPHYDWPSWINTLVQEGVSVSITSTFGQVSNALTTHFTTSNVWVIDADPRACICNIDPCWCEEITGTTGYPTQTLCEDKCCPSHPTPTCMRIYGTPSCNYGPIFNNMLSPLDDCCATIDNLTPTPLNVGDYILDNNGGKYLVQALHPCPQGGWGSCVCGIPTNYTSTLCGPIPQSPSSNVCLRQNCPSGQQWDYNMCMCASGNVPTSFIGDESHISVMIADFTNTDTQQVIQLINTATEILNLPPSATQLTTNTYSCNNNGVIGYIVIEGCLSKIGNSQTQYEWKAIETRPTNTYSCINGVCIEFNGPGGGYETLFECIQACDTIKGNLSKPTYNPQRSSTEVVCITPPTSTGSDIGTAPMYTSPVLKTPYVCKTKLNPLVGEYQKACIPGNDISGGGVLFNSLSTCLNGCAGWYNCNPINNIDVDGVTTTAIQAAPITMCCESYITKATETLTTQTCSQNCCDGTDTWFPLYNVIGTNNNFNSSLSYLQRRLSSLVNSKTCTVSETSTTYTNKGYEKTLGRISILPCTDNDNTVGYVDGKPCYSNIAEALTQAATEGCSGYHTHNIHGYTCYMACASHGGGSAPYSNAAGGYGPCNCGKPSCDGMMSVRACYDCCNADDRGLSAPTSSYNY